MGVTFASNSCFAGFASIPRNPCSPLPCPAPPLSTITNRDPYVPGWVSKLTQLPYGRMVVSFGDALYSFNSRCAGPLMFDPGTGNVTVGNPPYALSIPCETDFGYVGLVVPTEVSVCQDGSDTCQKEVRNQFAAQVMQDVDCGDVILANRPSCGQVNALAAADAQNQVRFDRATLKLLDDVDAGCSDNGDLNLFGFYPKLVTTPGGQSVCFQPVKVRRLRMKKEQWGTVEGDGADAADARIMVVKNLGGSSNPCMELQTSDISLEALNNAVSKPLQWLDLNDAVLIVNVATAASSQSVAVTLPSFPSFTTFCRAYFRVNIINQNSSASSSDLTINGVSSAHCGPQSQDVIVYPSRNVTSAAASFVISATGAARTTTVFVWVLGYLHD